MQYTQDNKSDNEAGSVSSYHLKYINVTKIPGFNKWLGRSLFCCFCCLYRYIYNFQICTSQIVTIMFWYILDCISHFWKLPVCLN